MTKEARWLSELDPEKRQWLLDHEGEPLPAGFAAAITAAGGPVGLAGWEGRGWSWTQAEPADPPLPSASLGEGVRLLRLHR